MHLNFKVPLEIPSLQNDSHVGIYELKPWNSAADGGIVCLLLSACVEVVSHTSLNVCVSM